MWAINVNESVSLEVNCNISDMRTNDLGIDVNIKNLNQVHHPLMTEIFINDMTLYCPAYALQKDKVTCECPIKENTRHPSHHFGFSVMQSPGYNRIFNKDGETGLRTTESISFRCSLLEKPKSTQIAQSPTEFIRQRLSTLDVKRCANVEKIIPDVRSLGSFLMKNETKFIGALGQTGNSEEFNNIVSTYDPHMTVALTWKAVVSDNSSVQRHTYGQHFVQLRHLYEM